MPTGQWAVVVPTRDRPALATEAAARIVPMLGPDDELVVVVDGGDVDATTEALRTVPRARALVGTGAGPATARNLGAAATGAEWLVFVDDDDVPDDDWLDVLRRLAAGPDAPVHVSVGHREARGDDVADAAPAHSGPATGGRTANYLAGTFAVRRDAFDAVGGFTDGLRHMEMTDLALRLLEHVVDAGSATAFDPAPHITMVVRPTTERASQDPAVLVDAATVVLDRNAHLLARDPAYLADQLATVGVAAWRAGRPATARALLWRTARLRRRPADVGRALVATVPPVARRVWGPPGR